MAQWAEKLHGGRLWHGEELLITFPLRSIDAAEGCLLKEATWARSFFKARAIFAVLPEVQFHLQFTAR